MLQTALKVPLRHVLFRQVRDELEHLLDDDMDMAAMHLSEKLAYQAADVHSSRFDVDNEPSEFDEERYRKLIGSKLEQDVEYIYQ